MRVRNIDQISSRSLLDDFPPVGLSIPPTGSCISSIVQVEDLELAKLTRSDWLVNDQSMSWALNPDYWIPLMRVLSTAGQAGRQGRSAGRAGRQEDR
ncbi:hypothetical protein BY996DRAFT_6618691 [Phakopsora pachyrhizi]|nr:hypothetical protein BY996DRAFT_6618691 [Phakopsora pachyrhizi]